MNLGLVEASRFQRFNRCSIAQKENLMLWTIIVILLVLWALGFFGRNISPSFPKTGSWIHTLLVIAIILFFLQMLGIINL
jgi:hypothetical protein